MAERSSKRGCLDARASGSSSSSRNGRPVSLKRQVISLTQRFVSCLMSGVVSGATTAVPGEAPEGSTVGSTITFESELLEAMEGHNVMFVRDCYPVLHATMLEISKEETEKGIRKNDGVLVTGTEGTGKTVLAAYTIRRLVLEEKRTVVLNFRNRERYVIAPSRVELEKLDASDPRRDILKYEDHFDRDGFEGETDSDVRNSCWWGEFTPEGMRTGGLYAELTNMKHVWLVVKYDFEPYVKEDVRCFVAVFDALRSAGFPSSTGQGSVPTLYVPVWEREEISRFVQARPDFFDKEEIEERFALYGGSARMLFNSGNTWHAVTNALTFMPMSDLSKPAPPGVLVHTLVSDDFRRVTGRTFASIPIGQAVINKKQGGFFYRNGPE